MGLLRTVVTTIALFILASSSALAKSDVEPLSYSQDQSSTTLAVLDALAGNHYRSPTLDDALSREFLENYIEQLDPSKSYFLASDIRRFKAYETRLDDLIKQGNLKPAYEIFNIYRDRVLARIDKNIALLSSESPFDFNADDTMDVDFEDNGWLNNEAELDALWHKRVKDSYLRLLLADKDEAEIPELLTKRYKNQAKRLRDMDGEDVYQLYINAFTVLYDPHTSYFSPRQLENFNISMSLSLEGIGAVLQSVDENTQIVRIVPGGPADSQSDLAPEDVIVGVGQGDDEMQDVIGWRLDDVVDLIRGKKGTTVRLEVIPAKGESAGINKVISIVRDEVKLEDQAAKSRVIEVESEGQPFRFGVIDIPTFYIDFEAYQARDPDFRSTTRDVAKLLMELKAQDVDGIILDLRNNGGGSLQEATTLTDLFINPGPVVQIRHTNQMISRQYRSRNDPFYAGPLIVMINRLSASASEIFAGAIQDYGRGLVVGSQSFGKGTVQTLLPLPAGQLKVTESKFYRVSGDSTQHRGVVPDIAFPSLISPEDIGESSEDHALPWDQIHGIPVARHEDFKPLLPLLVERHENRAKTDPDFAFLMDEIDYRQSRDDIREISLNLATRKAEIEKNERAFFTFENKRRAAKGLPPYESVAAWKSQNAGPDEASEDEVIEEESNDALPLDKDPLLKETGMILADQILLTAAGSPRLVKTED